MDLKFTPAEEAFRADVRAFFAEKLPRRLAERERRVMIDHQIGDEDYRLARFADLGRAA